MSIKTYVTHQGFEMVFGKGIDVSCIGMPTRASVTHQGQAVATLSTFKRQYRYCIVIVSILCFLVCSDKISQPAKRMGRWAASGFLGPAHLPIYFRA